MYKTSDINQGIIKASNKKKILNFLYKERETTKQDISKETGISIPTVTNNINQLLKEGIVEEAGVFASTGGRKPVAIKFMPNAKYAFGINISIDNVRIILVNLDVDIKYDITINTAQYKNFDMIIKCIFNQIEKIISEQNIPKEKILGIGFSLPGTVNEETMMLEKAPNLGIDNYNFKTFSRIYSYPIYIENEANAAALAELTLGITKKMRSLVYLSITQGIGSGVVLQDTLYKGKNKRAGEFGHMTIVADGDLCRCGKKGCWELYASEKALLQEYNKKSNSKIRSIKEFFNEMENKNNTAIKVWNNYINYLAIGIQNIILILDPHYIVIGGEISKFEKELLQPVKYKVFIKNSFYAKKDIKIVTSKLKEDASILGAALLPLESVR